LFRRLLSLNREITFAKFALESREVVLTVEVPTENLVWSQLKDGPRAQFVRHHVPCGVACARQMNWNRPHFPRA
jgi:hypothetical protein